MSNTTVTITYANGSTREFVASDDLEQLINDGEMFSVTTFHSDMGVAEEMLVSKMYVGNPIAAMGHMMMMLRNTQTMRKSKSNRIIKDVLTVCIKLMSDEITSFQSEMSPVMDNEKHDSDNKYQRAEKLIGELYLKCRDSQTINQHNPYTWAELNKDLMSRIQEFMPSVGYKLEGRQFKKGEPLVPDLKLVEDVDACAPLPDSQRQGAASQSGQDAIEKAAMINNPTDGTGSDDGCS